MSGDKARMRKNWFELAEKATWAMEGEVPYGTAMARREKVASELGITRQTLRNYMSAYDFVRRIAALDAAASAALAMLPATAVETYSRWYGRDPEAALSHARWAVAESAPVSVVIAAEQAARASSVRHSSAVSLVRRAIDAASSMRVDGHWAPHRSAGRVHEAMERVGAERMDLHSLVPVDADDPLAIAAGVTAVLEFRPDDYAVDRLMTNRPFHALRRQAGRYPVIGVIEAGPTSLADGHRRMGRSLFMRALSVAPLYPLSAILLPDRRACEAVVAALPHFDARAMGLRAVEPLVELIDGCVLVTTALQSSSVIIAHVDAFAAACAS